MVAKILALAVCLFGLAAADSYGFIDEGVNIDNVALQLKHSYDADFEHLEWDLDEVRDHIHVTDDKITCHASDERVPYIKPVSLLYLHSLNAEKQSSAIEATNQKLWKCRLGEADKVHRVFYVGRLGVDYEDDQTWDYYHFTVQKLSNWEGFTRVYLTGLTESIEFHGIAPAKTDDAAS